MFFSVLLFVESFYSIKIPKQEKKTFTVSESKCESHLGNLMKKKKKNTSFEVSRTISVQHPVEIRLLLVKRNSGK